jgi:hypothetical protein
VPFEITVTVQDAYNNTATGYSGTLSFSSADPYGAALPADYTYTAADNGVHTFSAGATLYTAGQWNVTATDTILGITGSMNVTVTPAAAVGFALISPVTVAADTPFDVAVTALDSYGNVDSNYRGMITFFTTDPDAGVVLPASYAFTANDAGMHTFASGAVLVTPGTQSIGVADTNDLTGSATLTVMAPTPPPGGGGGAARRRRAELVICGDVASLLDGGLLFWDLVPRTAVRRGGLGSRGGEFRSAWPAQLFRAFPRHEHAIDALFAAHSLGLAAELRTPRNWLCQDIDIDSSSS